MPSQSRQDTGSPGFVRFGVLPCGEWSAAWKLLHGCLKDVKQGPGVHHSVLSATQQHCVVDPKYQRRHRLTQQTIQSSAGVQEISLEHSP